MNKSELAKLERSDDHHLHKLLLLFIGIFTSLILIEVIAMLLAFVARSFE